MNREEFITSTAQHILLAIVKEWEDGEGLVELAKQCVEAAEVIWKKAHPLQ